MRGSRTILVDDAVLAQRELARQQRRLDLVFLRLLLQRQVRYVSPLVVDMLAGERLRLERLLLRFRPRTSTARWPQKLGAYATPRTHWRYMLPDPWRPQLSPDQTDLIFRDAMSARGLVVRLPSHEKGALGLSASEDQLEVEWALGGAHGWSSGEHAFVLVRRALPESVGLAIVGLPVGAVIDHPAFVGRDYPITGCTISDAQGECEPRTTIRFRTGRQPFEMPFAALMSDLARTAAARCRKGRI